MDLSQIKHKNIRATALDEFWGSEFEHSIYLWQGAKHKLTLSEIENSAIPALKDLFATKEEQTNAHQYCKDIYFKFLPILAEKLNEIHGLNLPVSFWRTVFGYWLFRHICIVYEKYSYLSKIDIDQTSIKLLDQQSFYIPHNHKDYFKCFADDFGVQQLVSQYYYLFRKRDFPCLAKNFKMISKEQQKSGLGAPLPLIRELIKRVAKNIAQRIVVPKILICRASFGSNVLKQLLIKSKGRIQPNDLPKAKISPKDISNTMRKALLNIDSENEFEYFLAQTFYYCFPIMLVEEFGDYYEAYSRDLKKSRFTHLVSEQWITDIPTSIYAAVAQLKGKRLIAPQHGASNQWLSNNMYWVDYLIADTFLTTGWMSNQSNLVPGGFSCRDIFPYQHHRDKKNILYIIITKFMATIFYHAVRMGGVGIGLSFSWAFATKKQDQ